MFDAEMLPRSKPMAERVFDRPAESPLHREAEHTALEVSLTRIMPTSGFVRGLTPKIIHLPIPLPAERKPVHLPTRTRAQQEAATMTSAGLLTGGPQTGQTDFSSSNMSGARSADGQEPVPGQLAEGLGGMESASVTAPDADGLAVGRLIEEEPLLTAGAPELADGRGDESLALAVEDGVDDAVADRSDAAALAQDENTAEAFERGRQAGLMEAQAAQGQAELTLEAAVEAAYARGRAEAEEALADQLAQATESSRLALNTFATQLEAAARDTEHFYAPLKRLAMHLAEQMVRGELSLSEKAIGRMIERSLQEFSQDPSQPVMLTMNPEDLSRFQASGVQLPKGMDLRGDDRLSVGSLRASMNGAVIEDLIEHRQQHLWQALMQDDRAAPPASFLQSVEQVREAFDDVFEVLSHDQP